MPDDLDSRNAIDALMRRFYERAMADSVIGFIFTDVMKLDLDHHLPVIGDFWESSLLGAGNYARHGRNPLLVHLEIDRRSRLEPEHFERWLQIFEESVDESFAGPYAEFAKQRSRAIARRMLEFLGEANAIGA